jgi:hypothetical protein
MKKILVVAAMTFSFIIGCTYTTKDKTNPKLHCKICNESYFVPSRRVTKFTKENEKTVVKTASFYKCAKCDFISDVVVSDK